MTLIADFGTRPFPVGTLRKDLLPMLLYHLADGVCGQLVALPDIPIRQSLPRLTVLFYLPLRALNLAP